MNKKKIVLLLILTLVSGSVAGYSVLQYLEDRPTPVFAAQSRVSSQSVVVAARDLDVGTTVGSEDVRLVDWPGEAVPNGYARSVDEVLGRGVITEVATNEPLISSKLADAEAGGGLPIVIPPGMRAVSVKVDEVIGVAGFVVPGTRVDVVLTMTPQNSNDAMSRVILENIRALAAGQETQQDEDGEPMTVTVVTVLVTPEQAEKLILAANQGRIQMALRNTLDLDSGETDGVRSSLLLSGQSSGGSTASRTRSSSSSTSTSSATPDPSPGIVEMYRGGARTLITY